DTRGAATALSSIETIDDALLAKLTSIVRTGDPQLIDAALGALGRAGEDALPVLRAAATTGMPNSRPAAVFAIGQLGGAKATQMLGEILNTGDHRAAMAASSALAGIGGKEARELLINAALGDRAEITGALTQ